MSKKFKVIIPCIFAGVLLVIIFSVYGLDKIDKTLSAGNVVTAFAKAYSDFTEGEADFTKMFRLYKNEKFRHSGSFSFSEITLADGYNYLFPLLKDIPVEYDILCSPSERATRASLLFGGEGQIHFDGYIDDENITVKLDEFYDKYFSIPNSNIKETYESSMWGSLFGNITLPLPDGFSINLYGGRPLSDYVISDFLKESANAEIISDVAEGVSVEKGNMHKDFFVSDKYISSNEYIITVSKSVMENFAGLIGEYTGLDRETLWTAEKYKFNAYISSENRLLGVKFDFNASYGGVLYNAETLISFLGKENIFDNVTIDLSLTGDDNSVYSFRMLLKNYHSADFSETIFIAAMNQPYVSRLFEVKAKRNVDTDETYIEAAVNIPGLRGNIKYNGSIYEDEFPVLAEEDVYKIYELNIWQILNIYSSANWSFIK